ncbi:MAG: ankyrin repeat domain-containing protein [Candidatus Eremiobacteraeota bacterium]|nr:ankyrin repeat domain-containing protein [Candidatus Eremiobacteraeota bacterium]
MKKHIFFRFLFILILFMVAKAGYSQNRKFTELNRDWIQFSYPSECRVEEQRIPGDYDRVIVTSPEGYYWMLTAFRKKAEAKSHVKSLKDEFRRTYEKMGAKDIVIKDAAGIKPPEMQFSITYTLKGVKYKNDSNYYVMDSVNQCTTLCYPLGKSESSALHLLIDIQENGSLFLKGDDIFAAIHLGNNRTAKELADRNPSLLHARKDIGRCSGVTPLHLAVSYENLDLVNYFLSQGVEADIKDNDDFTPLHNAAIHALSDANKKIIEVLLAHDAHLNAKNKYGQTPLDVAEKHNPNNKMAEYLKKIGAKPGKSL